MHATRDKPNPISNYPNSTTNQISKHPARARLAKKRECPSNEPVLAANRKASGIRTRIQHRPNPPKRIKSRAATGEGGECGECSPWSRTGEWAAAEVRWSPTVRVCLRAAVVLSPPLLLFFSFRWWLRRGTSCQCGHVPSREVTGILPWAGDLDLDGRPRPFRPNEMEMERMSSWQSSSGR